MLDGSAGPMLELDRVSKSYGLLQAVRDVSLAVKRGEFLTLLGPSGCGKTTILRMIAGFVEPTSGMIRIAGRPMDRVPPYDRQIGYVFQNLALFPHLTVEDNIGFGLSVRGVRRAALKASVEAALDLVDLRGAAPRRVHELSGGQRQRIALARALVVQPTVLLLDEPLGALDLQLRRQMQAELKRIHRQLGTTFVLVTHDQEEALTLSDRILVMNGGQVEQVGSAAELYTRPASLFVAQFVGDTNLLQGTVAALGSLRPQVAIGDMGAVVESAADWTPRIGEQVVVSIRPEDIVLLPPAEGGAAAIRGCLQDVTYAGARRRCTVQVGGTRIRADLAGRDAGRDGPGMLLTPGAEVCVAWNSAAAWLLRGCQAAAAPRAPDGLGEQAS